MHASLPPPHPPPCLRPSPPRCCAHVGVALPVPRLRPTPNLSSASPRGCPRTPALVPPMAAGIEARVPPMIPLIYDAATERAVRQVFTPLCALLRSFPGFTVISRPLLRRRIRLRSRTIERGQWVDPRSDRLSPGNASQLLSLNRQCVAIPSFPPSASPSVRPPPSCTPLVHATPLVRCRTSLLWMASLPLTLTYLQVHATARSSGCLQVLSLGHLLHRAVFARWR